MTDKNRVRDVLLGALLADALGVPHEFKGAAEIPMPRDIRLVMPASYPKTYSGVPYGVWSDDGSQMLCLLETLAAHQGRLDLDHFAHLLLEWRWQARHQSGGKVFDVGLATDAALQNIARGINPAEAGGRDKRSNGNGSLMRVLPVALAPVIWGISEDLALQTALRQSVVTHAHPISQACCGVYIALAMRLWHEPGADLGEAVAEAFARVSGLPDLGQGFDEALATIKAFGVGEMPTGSGYVVDCFWSAIRALQRAENYLDAVRAAIGYGGDTDTTAIVCGGLATIKFGVGDVPREWWGQVQMPQETQALLTSL